jgi:hypothetical protein
VTMDRQSWRKKFQLVKNEWRALRPEERAKHRPRFSKLDFGFMSSRSLTDEVEVTSHVGGWQIEDSEWSFRVRIAIRDRRVAKLRSEVVTTFDTRNLTTVGFDVLAAALAIEGRELEPSPLVRPSSTDDEVRLLVKEFSDRIDKIWTFAHGFTIEGLETLSIWAIRNRNFVGIPKGPPAYAIGVICTAFVYGERELSRELLWEYEIHLEKRRRSEVFNEPTRAVHATLTREVMRLKSLLS